MLFNKSIETQNSLYTDSINDWSQASAGLSLPDELSNPLQPTSFSRASSSFLETLSVLDSTSNLLDDTQTSNSTIQGTKWNDLNGNGVQDAGEPGLAGWTIYLDQNNNRQLDLAENFTTTDQDGEYSFTDLAPGTYTVAEVLQPGWQQTSPRGVTNGSFETGNLTGWNTLGNTSIQTAAYGTDPSEGTYEALLTTSSDSVTDSALESFLGLSAGALDEMGNGNATKGSAIKLSTMTVAAGTTLTFDWNFLSNEGTPSFYNDFTFVSIDGLSQLADTNSSFVLSPTVFNQETGYARFSYTFTTAGTYSIGLGVVNVGDAYSDSALLVDNVSLTNAVQVVNLTSAETVNNINFGNKVISVLAEPNDTIHFALDSGLSSTSPRTFKDAGAIGDNPNMAPELDVDFIKIQLNAGDRLKVDIDTNQITSALNSVLRLFDSAGNQVAFNDDATASGESSSLDSYIEFAATVSGTYYVALSSSGKSSYNPSVQGSGSLGSTGSYSIEVSVTLDYNSNYGYGLVDAAAAVAKALGQSGSLSDVANLGGNSWGLDMVNAPEVWAKGYTGQDIVVAVVDSGVDYTHPDLDANIWSNSDEITDNGIDDDSNGYIDDIRGWDFDGNDNAPTDLNGHGTHVAGIIAAEKNNFGVTGVAYNATIMPVKVGNNSPSSSAVAKGVRYAADNGADVINLSLGLPNDSEVAAAIKYATEKGTVVVMAAGNEYSSQPRFPASLVNQWGIAVGSVDSTKTMAGSSNRAGTTPLDCVVAPGVNVYSTTPNDTYGYKGGTSMASPHVAGVVALMLSANPNLTAAEVESIISQTANAKGITA